MRVRSTDNSAPSLAACTGGADTHWVDVPPDLVYQVVSVVADPGREFAFRRRAAGSDVTWRYRLTPAGDGTE